MSHDVQPHCVKEHQRYVPNTAPMNDQSVYRHEFTEKPQCAAKIIKPISERKDNGLFDGATTNRSKDAILDMKLAGAFMQSILSLTWTVCLFQLVGKWFCKIPQSDRRNPFFLEQN